MTADTHHLPAPTDNDLRRIRELYSRCDPRRELVLSARDVFDVIKLEHQMRAEQAANDRIVFVSWILALATVALVVATAALIYAN